MSGGHLLTLPVSEYSCQSVCVCSTEVVRTIKETKRVYKHVDARMSDVRTSVNSCPRTTKHNYSSRNAAFNDSLYFLSTLFLCLFVCKCTEMFLVYSLLYAEH